MRERLALALGEKHFELRGHGLAFSNEYVDAVLTAMREPTETMKAAGERALDDATGRIISTRTATDAYVAMIDDALAQ